MGAEHSNLSLTELNTKTILKTTSVAEPELGHFSTSLVVYQTVYELLGSHFSSEVARILGNDLPLYDEINRTQLSPNEILSTIKENLGMMFDELQKYERIIFVGIESIIIDNFVAALPEATFYLISHSDMVNKERLLANFSTNVSLASVRDITILGGPNSILFSYIFCQTQEQTALVYPITIRAIGVDVRQLYSQVIGLNILPPYKRYLHKMSEISSTDQFFTKQYQVI